MHTLYLSWKCCDCSTLTSYVFYNSSDSKACERFGDLMMKKPLLKDIAKISPRQQTSSLESFHSLILRFAPKNVVYPFIGMLCRLVYLEFCFTVFDIVSKDRQERPWPCIAWKCFEMRKILFQMCYVGFSSVYTLFLDVDIVHKNMYVSECSYCTGRNLGLKH